MEDVEIIIAFDSIGDTAELAASACAAQFSPKTCKHGFLRYPYIGTFEGVDGVMQVAIDKNVITIYALVEPEVKAYMKKKVDDFSLKAVDIIDPLMALLNQMHDKEPYSQLGKVHKLDDVYFKKVDAIELAVKYDGGKDAKGLPKADIVLIGTSGASKTLLSQYLAHKSYKVMSIPLVPKVTPPDELFKINPAKCIALKVSEDKLNLIRKQRLKQPGLGEHAKYATEDRVKERIQHFEKIVERVGYPVIDVSDKAVEETADDVIQIIESKV